MAHARWVRWEIRDAGSVDGGFDGLAGGTLRRCVCVVCVIVWMGGGMVGGKGDAAFRLSGGVKGSLVRLFRLGSECVVVSRYI